MFSVTDVRKRLKLGEIVCDSLQLVDEINKIRKFEEEKTRKKRAKLQHKTLLEKLRKFNTLKVTNCEEVFYINKQNKKHIKFNMSEKEFIFFIESEITRMNIGTVFEDKFYVMLNKFFKGELQIISQFRVDSYKIDFYLPALDLIVEYDEEHHEWNKEKDKERMVQIISTIKAFLLNFENEYGMCEHNIDDLLTVDETDNIIRVKKGEEIEGIRRILDIILDRYSGFSDSYLWNENFEKVKFISKDNMNSEQLEFRALVEDKWTELYKGKKGGIKAKIETDLL